jgi:hypothetical protein
MGTFYSSPVAPSPGYWERNRARLERLSPLDRPSELCISRKSRDRKLHVHAARRAAKVAKIMKNED